MNIIEAAKSGRGYKRKHGSYWFINKIGHSYSFLTDDIIADDWELREVKAKWYKGNFKERYPNGVLCYVSGSANPKDDHTTFIRIIVDYKTNSVLPFIADNSCEYRQANPASERDAPTIIKNWLQED